jgi:aerobic carbon-monoxide dehydrogenase large subunit
VEDNRFIRGKGNYVDDIVLPGMLHMEILRSPLAHARIRVDRRSKAWAIPGVRLVLTGEMMAARNLAWMPTLSYDTQAVLATDKVRFQGQEVAASSPTTPTSPRTRARRSSSTTNRCRRSSTPPRPWPPTPR